MKLNGIKLAGPSVDYVVIPRPTGDIILTVQAVLDNDEFNRVYPEPEPPKVIRPNQAPAPNYDDDDYKKLMSKRSTSYTKWLILKSLSATKGLEWETILMEKPDTWARLDDELKGAGFSQVEVARIYAGVISVNGLNESKVEEARKRFLATLSDQPKA